MQANTMTMKIARAQKKVSKRPSQDNFQNRNYLWYGFENTTIARVSWDDCMMPKEVGSCSFILLEVAMKALSSKWILQALLPGMSNLQIILR